MPLAAAVLSVEHLSELEEPWRALADRGDNVFGSYEWNRTWWNCFGGGRPLRVIACEDGTGRLSALVPLYEATRRPTRVLRLVGHGASDQLGPVGGVGVGDSALSAARHALDADRRWGLTMLEDLPGDCACQGRSLAIRSSPTVAFVSADWQGWLASKSRNFRHQVGKVERRLARRGRLRFRLAGDLRAFRALHEAHWGPRSRAFAGRWPFHERFAADAHERGWLRIHLLDLDDRPVAALYNLRFGGVECCYQAGRLPALSGAGFVLHAHAIRAAMQDGMREYRFLRGDESYKLRFANADPGVRTVAYARGARGHAMLRALVATTPLPPALRWRLPSVLRSGLAGAPVASGR